MTIATDNRKFKEKIWQKIFLSLETLAQETYGRAANIAPSEIGLWWGMAVQKKLWVKEPKNSSGLYDRRIFQLTLGLRNYQFRGIETLLAAIVLIDRST